RSTGLVDLPAAPLHSPSAPAIVASFRAPLRRRWFPHHRSVPLPRTKRRARGNAAETACATLCTGDPPRVKAGESISDRSWGCEEHLKDALPLMAVLLIVLAQSLPNGPQRHPQ